MIEVPLIFFICFLIISACVGSILTSLLINLTIKGGRR